MIGLYVANYDLKDYSDGVSKKINAQIKCLKEHGIDIEVLDSNFVHTKDYNKLFSLLREMFGHSSDVLSNLLLAAEKKIKEEKKYNFIYLRKGRLDCNQVRILKRIKLEYPAIKILMEIPTYPYLDEISFFHMFLKRNEIRAIKSLRECVDYIVTFSKDECIFGIPTIKIMNGIDYSKIRLRTYKDHSSFNMIAVALFAKWHGYDRLIDGMNLEFDFIKENDIHLYLIGKGKVLKRYKKLINKYSLGSYVHFTGPLNGEKLDDYYDIADVAIDCCGRHRVGVYYNSTLKGKEYCAHGVPIVSGVNTELDNFDKFSYYKRFPANDSYISIKEIFDFVKSLGSDYSTISTTIRYQTEPVFDMKHTFLPVVDCLQKL